MRLQQFERLKTIGRLSNNLPLTPSVNAGNQLTHTFARWRFVVNQ